MRQILLYVFSVGNDNDPMELIKTTRAQRATASVYSRTFPLLWDPPPDTLFMRATDLDLGVFGEDLDDGHLQMIDAAHAYETLRDALERDADATVEALHALSQKATLATPREAIAEALRSGEWPHDLDGDRGPILQAAGFARQLLGACQQALPDGMAVVWDFTGGPCRYDYPHRS